MVAYIFKQLQQSIRHQPKKPMELWVANEESHNKLKHCKEKAVSLFTKQNTYCTKLDSSMYKILTRNGIRFRG